MDQTDNAKRFLNRRGVTLPETDEAIRMLAYEEAKGDDFLLAHIFRLNKERVEFTKEDWASILEMSGKEKVLNNVAGLMACLSHGLVTPA